MICLLRPGIMKTLIMIWPHLTWHTVVFWVPATAADVDGCADRSCVSVLQTSLGRDCVAKDWSYECNTKAVVAQS